MFSVILLAAGLSRRFISPKALATLAGKTVIRHILDTLLDSACDEIIVVLGADAQQIQPYVLNHKRIRIVHNKDYFMGQSSSIRSGLGILNPQCKAFLIVPVDCPLVKSSTINTLMDAFQKNSPLLLVPAYKNKRGHPPVFDQSLKEQILQLPSDQGINAIFKKVVPQTLEIDDPGITASFNTPEEFEKIIFISKRGLLR